MKKFSYQYILTDGRIAKDQLAALNEQDALGKIARLGRKTTQLSELKSSTLLENYNTQRNSKLSSKQRSEIYRKLGTLIQAGLSPSLAFQVIARTSQAATQKTIINNACEQLAKGKNLVECISEFVPAIENAELGMLRLAEYTGKSQTILLRLADQMERGRDVRSKLIAALVYPAFLIVLLPVILVVITAVLVPNLAPLFEGNDVSKPLSLSIMIWFHEFVSKNMGLILVGFFMIVCSLVLVAYNPTLRRSVVSLAVSLPLFKKIRRDWTSVAICRTIATLLENGATLQMTLQEVSRSASTHKLASTFERVRQKLSTGKRLATSLQEESALDADVLQFIAIGEQTNQLPAMLIFAANTLEKELMSKLERGMTLLTPLITLALGVLIGGIVMSVMRAILALNMVATQ